MLRRLTRHSFEGGESIGAEVFATQTPPVLASIGPRPRPSTWMGTPPLAETKRDDSSEGRKHR